MKKVDSNEFYNSKETNQINEYQSFPAEQYYSNENASTPPENTSFNEDNINNSADTQSANTYGNDSEISNSKLDNVQRQANNLNQNATPDVSTSSGSTASTSSASSMSSTAATASTTSTVAATTASVASVATTAVVAVVAVTGLLVTPEKFIDIECGMDYSAITINVDKMIKEDAEIHNLLPNDFQIIFKNGEDTITIDLTGGESTYLITGLSPNEQYSYDISCKKNFNGNNRVYYTDTITTSGITDPKGIYDSLNNSIIYDSDTKTATINYSIYLSDYERKYSDSTFYVCSEAQTDFTNLNNVLYSSKELDQANYFKGNIEGITYDHLYYYVIGHGSDEKLLFCYDIDVNLPEDWINSTNRILDISEEDINYTYLPDNINITGKLNNYDSSYTVGAYYNEYNTDGTNLSTNKEAILNIDSSNMTYEISFDTSYGISSYDYTIYFLDSNSNKIKVYESGNITFTTSQAFSATYKKVEPSEAKVVYNSDSVVIEVDPSFTSENTNEYYKLEVLNSSNTVLGSYEGTEKAVITITDYSNLDQIIFKYYECATYLDEEVVFDTYTTAGVDFGYHTIDISEEDINYTYLPDSITITGKLNNYNSTYTVGVYYNEYNTDGTSLSTNKEAILNIDSTNMTYEISFDTSYGITNYDYTIYFLDSNSNKIEVYESGNITFTTSQEFSATYDKVEPSEAKVVYSLDSVSIEVETNFTSENTNEYYKLEVLNSSNTVLGSYEGTEKAVITISDYSDLDQIIFKYYECATYLDEEVVFDTYTTAGVDFGYHAIDISEEDINYTYLPDNINITGKLNNYDSAYAVGVYFNEYSSDGTSLSTNKEAILNIDSTNMTYGISFDTSYGISSYDYTIYFLDSNSNKIKVYESGNITFTTSQAFSATYTKVEPSEAKVEYSSDSVVIEVDPSFTSENTNEYYKLEVLNSSNEVLGSYEGTEKAVITITDYSDLDQIIFKYYDCATYLDEEVVFDTYTTAGVDFGYHAIDISEDDINYTYLPDNITIKGKLNNYDSTYTVGVYYNEYNTDGTSLSTNKEAILNIDSTNMTYKISFDTAYGSASYDYTIYFLDSNSNKIKVYESGNITFTTSQAFSATYTKVEPSEAKVEYSSDSVVIEVDPSFTSENTNEYYKLEVLNSSNEVLGSYEGTEKAVITITDYSDLDQIIFKYYDCATYLDEEVVFDTYTTAGVDFGYHAIDISEEDINYTYLSDNINITGKLNNYDSSYTVGTYYNEYNTDGTSLSTNKEAILNIDSTNMTYKISFDTAYGISSYDYTIYFLDSNSNKIKVYESGNITFTKSQAFSATYTKVEPSEAKVEYSSDSVVIEVDPSFTSENTNEYYKLEVLNSSNTVLGSYEGTEKAVITITDYSDLDQIIFKYYECATYLDEEVVFDTYTTAGVDFGYHAIDISEEDISYEYTPYNINITGKLNNYDSSYEVLVYFNEYGSDGTNLITNAEESINIDSTNMTYEITYDVAYGVINYDYSIYFADSDSNEYKVFESGNINFGTYQGYSASFDKVKPLDATLTFNSDSLVVEVNPSFTSSYSNEYYKLEVQNEFSEVYGSYEGTGKASITIADCTGLNQIFFQYYGCATYKGEVQIFDSFSTDGVLFGYPSVLLSDSLGYDGTYFTVEYECNMVYNYSLSSLSLEIIDEGNNTYNVTVDTLEEKGTITLDCITGEIGKVNITPKLTFVDNTTNAKSHNATFDSKLYEMNYSFEITNVKADISKGESTIPITMNFSYDMPETFKISITDGNTLDIETPICEEYYFNVIDSLVDTELTVQVKDKEGNNWGNSIKYNVSMSSAQANYTSPSMTSTNPGDAVVTYNDDGTINIYRKIDFSCSNPNVYYNAFIYNGFETDSETGREIFSNCYDCIGTSQYAIIENALDMNYYFIYYTLYDYNNVTYVMYEERPSGGIYSVTSTWSTISVSSGKTTIYVSNPNGLKIDNRIIVGGIEYQYTTYGSETDSEFMLEIEGELSITTVNIFATDNSGYYDAYSNDIVLKGNKYKELVLTPTKLEGE